MVRWDGKRCNVYDILGGVCTMLRFCTPADGTSCIKIDGLQLSYIALGGS